MLNRNLVKTYAEVAKSRAVMASAIEGFSLQGITVEDLQKKLTVTPENGCGSRSGQTLKGGLTHETDGIER